MRQVRFDPFPGRGSDTRGGRRVRRLVSVAGFAVLLALVAAGPNQLAGGARPSSAQLTASSASPPLVAAGAAPNPALVGAVVRATAVVHGGTDPLSFSWTLTTPPGSAAVLGDPSVATPTFTPDVGGSYRLVVTVTDAHSRQAISPPLVVEVPTLVAPTVAARASPNPATVGALVHLAAGIKQGTPSFTYSWSLTPPLGSSALLSSPSATAPTFTPDVAGSYRAVVTVTDAHGLSTTSAPVAIEVPALVAPTVAIRAAPNPAAVGTAVHLTVGVKGGTGPISDAWTLTTPPGSTALLSSLSIASPAFTPDVGGWYQLVVTVTDAHGLSTTSAPLSVVVPGGVPLA